VRILGKKHRYWTGRRYQVGAIANKVLVSVANGENQGPRLNRCLFAGAVEWPVHGINQDGDLLVRATHQGVK
jgi:hypothetical protein